MFMFIGDGRAVIYSAVFFLLRIYAGKPFLLNGFLVV